MVGFKGRLAWVQYMPKKPTKWGMKAWVLADRKTGYVHNLQLYTGRETDREGNADKGLAHRVVTDLLVGLEGKGYHLSPALFLELHSSGFEATGTVRSNRQGISQSFRSAKLKKGIEK